MGSRVFLRGLLRFSVSLRGKNAAPNCNHCPMKPFRFPLQKVLEWRRTQLELQEAACKRQAAEVAALDRAREALRVTAARAESELRGRNSVSGSDLAALAGFREQVKKRDRLLAAQRAEAQKKLEQEQLALLEARRRCRLLERLEERRRREWAAETDRKLEETAAESYLARWVRGQA